MKILNATAIVAIVGLSAVGFTQRPGQGRQGGPGGGMMGGRGRDPKQMAERQTQMMTEALQLTAAQQSKVKAIILNSQIQAKKIRDAQNAAIMKLLSADQKKKMAAMRGPGGGMGRPGGGRGGA